SKLKPIEKTLLVSWIIAWTFCGIVIGLSMFNNYSRDIKLMMFVYMVFWIFYEYRVLKTLFWRLWGVEYLRIDEAGIDYKRDIKGYGKILRLFKENIRKIETLKIENNAFLQSYFTSFWIMPNEKILISHSAKATGVGLGLTNEAANKLTKILIDEIKKRHYKK